MKRPAASDPASYRRARWLAWCACLGVLASSHLASAADAPTASDEARLREAKALFDAGATQYEIGDYLFAIQAFEQAYAIAPREGIVFSMAQAHRRQHTRTNDAKHLARAIELYREYLARVPSGGRVADAVKALEELESRAGAAVPVGPRNEGEPTTSAQTRIVVNIVVPQTTISIDGGSPASPPLNLLVAPGRHRVVLRAPGYFDEEFDVFVAEGQIAPANVPQRERPASVRILGGHGANLSVDGRLVGMLPLARPVELPSGRHFLSAELNGHVPFSAELDLRRAEERLVSVELEPTTQRRVGWGLTGGAIGLGVVASVFATVAVTRDQVARGLLETRGERALTMAERDEYESAREDRSLFIAMSAGGFGAATLFGASGLGLLFFDEPRAPVVPVYEAPSRRAPVERPSMNDMMTSVFLGPVDAAGPSFGVSARARF